jgi:hypothetical protein
MCLLDRLDWVYETHPSIHRHAGKRAQRLHVLTAGLSLQAAPPLSRMSLPPSSANGSEFEEASAGLPAAKTADKTTKTRSSLRHHNSHRATHAKFCLYRCAAQGLAALAFAFAPQEVHGCESASLALIWRGLQREGASQWQRDTNTH